jgi:hypothetical protein
MMWIAMIFLSISSWVRACLHFACSFSFVDVIGNNISCRRKYLTAVLEDSNGTACGVEGGTCDLCGKDTIMVPTKSLKSRSARKTKITTCLSLEQQQLLRELHVWRYGQRDQFCSILQLPDQMLVAISRCPEAFSSFEFRLSTLYFEQIGKLVSNFIDSFALQVTASETASETDESSSSSDTISNSADDDDDDDDDDSFVVQSAFAFDSGTDEEYVNSSVVPYFSDDSGDNDSG